MLFAHAQTAVTITAARVEFTEKASSDSVIVMFSAISAIHTEHGTSGDVLQVLTVAGTD